MIMTMIMIIIIRRILLLLSLSSLSLFSLNQTRRPISPKLAETDVNQQQQQQLNQTSLLQKFGPNSVAHN